jgi:hypothetical protein
MFLQHIFPHTDLKLQLKVNVIHAIKCTLDFTLNNLISS